MTKKSSKILPVIWIPVLLLILMVQFLGCQSAPPPPPAPAPDAAKAPVDIKASGAAAPAETASPSPTVTEESGPIIPATFKPKSKKDPFIPVVPGPQDTNIPVTPTIDVPVTPNNPEPGSTKTPSGDVIKPKPTPKPTPIVHDVTTEIGVTISGIMRVGGGYRAILNGSGGSSYIVTTGEMVGEYTVTSINARSVVLTYKKGGNIYRATLKLKSDHGSSGKGGGTAPKTDAGPRAPGGEAPPPAP